MKRLVVLFMCLLLIVFDGRAQQVVSNLSCRRFTTLDGLPQMQVETVWQDNRGYIWIGTLSGFARFDGLTLQSYLKGRRENIVGFAQIDDGVRALGFRKYWMVDNDKTTMRQIDPERKWLINNFNAADLPDGVVLLEDEDETHRRLCRLENEGWSVLRADTMLDRMTPDRKMFLDGDAIYLPTSEGLYVARGKARFTLLSPRDDVFALHRLGDVLYAFAADGIYTVGTDGLTLAMAYQFDAPDYGLFVRHDRKGRLLMADSHTLYCYDGQSVTRLADGINIVKGLFVDKWDRMWVATYQGVYCYFTRDFVNHRLTDGNDIARALAVDGKGRLVMGTLDGKVLVDGEAIYDDKTNFFVPSAAVVGGDVFLAGKLDIYHIIEGQSVVPLGLPYERYQFVTAAMGKVVMGTRQLILAYDPSTRRVDTLSTEINHPWCAATDAKGHLWVGSTFGVFKLTPNDNNKWQCELVGRENRVVTAMANDLKGNVFFAADDSVFLIREGKVEVLSKDMPLLQGHEVRSLHISPKGVLIVATIDGLFLAAIDNDYHVGEMRFFDHLNGFTMVEPLKAAMAEEADGTVWLAGLEEATSFVPESLMQYRQEDTIVVPEKKWWQKWWVWCIFAILLSTVVWWLAKWYEQRRSRRILLALQREKKQKELQINAIRLKSIPHFNSNVLSGIEYFVMNHSVEEASHYLGLYSKFTNSTLADIDLPARSVVKEVEYVENYLQLEQMRYGEKLTYSIIVEPEVNPQALLPNMLLHTYCQNAIKHGIAHKTSPGKVLIHIGTKQAEGHPWVVVTVEDNGVGREAAAKFNTHSTKQGLTILLEQINLHNQMNTLHITQKVDDLKDDEGKPAGTRYVMEIPENYIYE